MQRRRSTNGTIRTAPTHQWELVGHRCECLGISESAYSKNTVLKALEDNRATGGKRDDARREQVQWRQQRQGNVEPNAGKNLRKGRSDAHADETRQEEASNHQNE